MKSRRPIGRVSGGPDVTSSVPGAAWQNRGSSGTLEPATNIRKQIYELTLEDLSKFPVWEFQLDERGRDECTVRPYTVSGRLDPAERMFVVRTIFTLADGSRMQGYCSPSRRENESIGTLQPIIITDRGQVRFWCGTSVPDSDRLTRCYEWLGKEARDIFPAVFESEVELIGHPVKGLMPGFLVMEDFQTRKTRTVI